MTLVISTAALGAACSSASGEPGRGAPPSTLESAPTSTTVPTSASTRVALVGDSIALEARDDLTRRLDERGETLDAFTRGGTSPCDWRDTVSAAITPGRYRAVVIVFVGNRWTPCMQPNGRFPTPAETVAQYRSDVADLAQLINQRGAPVYFVIPPAMDPIRQPEQAQLSASVGRDVYRDVARREPGVTTIDPAPALSATYLESDRCRPDEADLCSPNGTVQLRTTDGIHICPIDPDDLAARAAECPVPAAGARRLAQLIADAVVPRPAR